MEKTDAPIERIEEQHRELKAQIDSLREFLRRPRPSREDAECHAWAAEMSESLLRLHDLLFRHFRTEECGGFLEEIDRAHPRATHRIEALRRDHDRFLAVLRAILSTTLSYGEGKTPDNPRLRLWVEQLLDGVAAHDREETDLLQRLLCEDIGTAD